MTKEDVCGGHTTLADSYTGSQGPNGLSISSNVCGGLQYIEPSCYEDTWKCDLK